MNVFSTKEYLKIIELGSYDNLIGMDWLEKHSVFLDCYNKDFTCLNKEGNSRMVQGIPIPTFIRDISSLQLKISLVKGAKYMQPIWNNEQRMSNQVLKTIQF